MAALGAFQSLQSPLSEDGVGHVIEALLALIALWSAHLAGAHYALGQRDPKQKRQGVLRTLVAVAALGAIIAW